MVLGRAEPHAGRRASWARPSVRGRRGRTAEGGTAEWADLRHYGNARVVLARAGAGSARGARGQGRRLSVEEDDRARRRRGAGQLQADESTKGGHADPE